VLGGLALCAVAPALVAWISELRGAPLMGAYFVHHLPVAPALGDCLAVTAVAGALAALAITLAARRADALAPQEVLRHE
jgi:ABC-type lipoprotein release transport system permease subunit